MAGLLRSKAGASKIGVIRLGGISNCALPTLLARSSHLATGQFLPEVLASSLASLSMWLVHVRSIAVG